MQIKRIVIFALIILEILFLFFFSSQDGVESENLSDNFTLAVIDVVKPNINKSDKEDLIIKCRFLVRKFAHFILFFTMGLLLYLLLDSYNLEKKVLCSILISLLIATLDETHQLFSSGRSARLLDIVIDMIGSSSSVIFMSIIKKIKRKNLINK